MIDDLAEKRLHDRRISEKNRVSENICRISGKIGRFFEKKKYQPILRLLKTFEATKILEAALLLKYFWANKKLELTKPLAKTILLIFSVSNKFAVSIFD